MELRHIEYFEAVSRMGNFTKAAQELYVSQPSITIAIQKLEEELGLKLIHRDNKKVSLTKEGEIFLEQGREILKKVRDTLDIMEAIKPNSKKILSLAFPPTLGSWLWPIIFNDFIKEYPDVEIDIRDIGNIEVIRAIKSNEIELGFGVVETECDLDLEIRSIFKGEMNVLISSSHKYKDYTNIPISFLADERIIMYRKETSYMEKRIKHEFEKVGIFPKIMYVTEQVTIFNLVAQGYGISVTLDNSSNIIRNNPNLICKPFENPIYYHTGIMWDKNKYLSNTARKFINCIIK